MATEAQQNRSSDIMSQPVGPKSKQRAVASTTPAAKTSKKEVILTHEQIAKRAYEIWLACSCEQGRDVEHWVEAERQLRQQEP
jgi:hypothetical protein